MPPEIYVNGMVKTNKRVCRKNTYHQTTVAPRVLMVTVQQVLFRKTHKLTRLNETCTLECSRRRKHPARPASSLILHGSDCSDFDPIDIVWQTDLFSQEARNLRVFHSVLEMILEFGIRGHRYKLSKLKVLGELCFRHIRVGIMSENKLGFWNLQVVKQDPL
jgi:hypothetical protein